MAKYVAPLRFVLVLTLFFVVLVGCAAQPVSAPQPQAAAPTQAPAAAATQAPAAPAQASGWCKPEEPAHVPVLAVQTTHPDAVSQFINDLLPPRKLCNIANTPLAPLKERPGVDVGRTLIYTNELGQTFDISLRAANKDAVDAYIKDVKVCFEASPSDAGVTPAMRAQEFMNRGLQDGESFDLAAILIETTGVPSTDLAARRDAEDGAAQLVTLAEILSQIGEDPNVVLAKAADEAMNRITTALNDGRLSWPDLQIAFGLDASQLSNATQLNDQLKNNTIAMLCQPDIPFLSTESVASWLVIEPIWVPTEAEQKVDDWIIWYAIDPTVHTIGRYRPEDWKTWWTGLNSYSIPCAWWTYAQLEVKGGTVSDSLSWNDPQKGFIKLGPAKGCFKSSTNGNICATSIPWTWPLYSMFYWPGKRPFYATVTGGENNSLYSIYGGWEQPVTCK
jgi:hypothetical protein